MDRVLLVIDDIQYAAHLETTLRKVGFDVEILSNEFNLPDKILTFNPDYIIVKGSNNRVSSANVGKKLKELTKYTGKVILIFPQDQKSSPDEFIKLRMDLILFDPISALRLVTHLLSLTELNKEAILDKLVRFAHTDTNFRTIEAQLLKNSGSTIDSEITIITGGTSAPEAPTILNEDDILNFSNPEAKTAIKKPEASTKNELASNEEFVLTNEYKSQLKSEIDDLSSELPLRIESYNHAIKAIDQDLKVGLNKRKTRETNKKLFKDLPTEENKKVDEERRRFVKALVKK